MNIHYCQTEIREVKYALFDGFTLSELSHSRPRLSRDVFDPVLKYKQVGGA
jgi:hypothetical protein